MSLAKHLEEAAARLQKARTEIELARAKPVSLESLGEWLAALTVAVNALADVHTFNNESIHEKLQALARGERL
jgi:hypothetical protein